MNVSANDFPDEQISDAIAALREIQAEFGAVPTLDFPFATPVSHVADYVNDMDRLLHYGSTVITNRCTHFSALTAIKAYWNIQTYLDGIVAGNALALPSASRGQIELFALCWHVFAVVSENAGFEQPDLARRMKAVDEALIMATFGTRSAELFDLYQRNELSLLRSTEPRDMEVFKAKNILTRIQKAGGKSNYPSCCDDYERLSELLHPNSPQNLIFMVPSTDERGSFRVALKDPLHVRRANFQSTFPILAASLEIYRLLATKPDPFPEGS
jgi:hypothetical protein